MELSLMNEVQLREQYFSYVETDAKRKAQSRLAHICKKRGGKFKLSEKQFLKEMEDSWLSGEFSAAERILRYIEKDDTLDTRDLIRGELHIFIMDLFKILKRRLELKEEVSLEDLLWGKYTTEKVLPSQTQSPSIQIVPDNSN